MTTHRPMLDPLPPALEKLRELGFPIDDETAPWLRRIQHYKNPDTEQTIVQPVFLKADAIRALAALTFEGFEVSVHSNPERHRITITSPRD